MTFALSIALASTLMAKKFEDDEFVTVNDAAELLKLGPGTVRNYIRDGFLPARRIGPRTVRILAGDLYRLAGMGDDE